MAALLMCAVTGILQTYLLSVILKGALNGEMKSAALAFLAKLVCYGIIFSLVWFFFAGSILYAAVGFIIGVVVSVVFMAVKSIINKSGKGDGLNEHGRAD